MPPADGGTGPSDAGPPSDGPRYGSGTSDAVPSGLTWRLDHPGGMDWRAAWGSGPDDVYVVGVGGFIAHSTAPGVWSLAKVDTSYGSFLRVVWGSGPDEVYASGEVPGHGASAPIFRTTDHGASWPFFHGTGYNSTSAIWGTSATDVWMSVIAAGGGTAVWHSSDHLATITSWNQVTPQLAFVVGVSGDAGQVFALRSDGMLARSTDKADWTTLPVPVTTPVALAVRSNNIFVLGPQGTVAHSPDGGATWSTAEVGGATTALWAAGPDDLWVVGMGGLVAHSIDGGRTFTRENVPTTADLYGVWGTGPRDVYVVGTADTILHGQ